MFTNLTNWLRPANRARRRLNAISRSIEALEDRTVLNSTYYQLATTAGTMSQDWTNAGLITNNNDWSNVPSIEGYSGAGLVGSAGINPGTITAAGGTLTVLANQNNPDTLNPTVGIAEFDGITDRTVALAGDAANSAPYLLFYLNTKGTGNVTVSYDIRDIDGSNRSTVSPVALQYRVSPDGVFTANGNHGNIAFQNVAAAYISDATVGGATKTTQVSAVLPSTVNEQSFVQVRIITDYAVDSTGQGAPNEWVGIDNIVIHGNMPPVIGINSTKLTYTENDPATRIDPGMTLSDIDSPDFNGGTLTVSWTSPASATDQLLVNNQGTGVGQIGVSGSNVTYTDVSGTTTIGTIVAPNDGTKGNSLVINFTSATATQPAVQALLRDICYINTSDDPIPGTPQSPPTRDNNVQFVMSDGDGETSAAVSRPLSVFAVDDPPNLALPGGPLTVVELAPATTVDKTATVLDPDSHDFNGGTLTVSIPVGATVDDFLTVENQGTGAGQVSVNPLTSEVSYQGTVIGVISASPFDGQNGNPLVITFNANAIGTGTPLSPPGVQAVVRAIQFQNTSHNPPTNARTLRFVLDDNDGAAPGLGSSGNIQVSVTIIPINDAPTLQLSLSSVTYTENNAPVVLDSGIQINDVDSPDFNTGTLTVQITANNLAEDRLSVNNQGNGPGQIGVLGSTVTYNPGSGPVSIGSISSSGVGLTKLQITFTPNASIAAVQALAREITYSNVSDNPSSAVRTVQFVVTDGDGGSSAPQTLNVNVVPVNDAPTIVVGGTISYSAGLPAVLISSTGTFTDPDSTRLTNGNLTVAITSGGLAGDTLGIRNAGTGAGKIGVSGTFVTYGGTQIGSYVGGANSNPLIVTFNNSATPAAAQALVQSITFKTPNGVGVTGPRSITFTGSDDQGAISNSASVTVSVTSNAGPQDDFYETNEDVALHVPANGVLANDPNPAQLVVNTTPISNTSNGILVLHADGSFDYTPNPDWNGTDKFTYQWIDTTNPATKGTAQVTITVDPLNDPPSVQLLTNDVIVNEDSGVYSQGGFATIRPGPVTAVDEAGQIVTTTISSSNPSLFSTLPTLDSSGRLTFAPAPDANGVATVTITSQDNGGIFVVGDQDTTQVSFTITVNPVNDQPSFQITGNPATVAEDAGQQTDPGFAVNFKPGPATAVDEKTQVPTYIITPIGNSAPQSPTGKLEFTFGPTVNASGDLVYTPAPNSNGTATFIIQANDGGGTANGGIDTSAPRTFTITVTPVNDPPTVVNDTATILWNSPANAIPVLANDSGFPDVGETVIVIGTSQGSNGTVVIQPGGLGITYQPATGFVGTDTFQYTATDGHGGSAIGTVTVNVVRADTTATDIIALGAGPGGGSAVRIYNGLSGQFVAGFTAFDPSFEGGISVATGDVNGDGVTDVIIGAGAGGGPRVEVIDGRKLGLLQGINQIANPSTYLANFFAYDWNFTGGVTVAAGDVNGDGKADVIVGTGVGGGPNVKVISGARVDQTGPDGLPSDSAVIASFFAYDASFRGGINVAAGDVNGDGFFDVVTAAGAGGGAHVKAFSGFKLITSGPLANGILLASFYGYEPSFRGGVTVAVGDVNGDGLADYILGAGPGGGSHVKVYSAVNLATPISSFFAFDPSFGGGVNVGYRTRSNGSAPLILAGTGVGTPGRLIGFAAPGPTAVLNIDAFDPGFLGGVNVG